MASGSKCWGVPAAAQPRADASPIPVTQVWILASQGGRTASRRQDALYALHAQILANPR